MNKYQYRFIKFLDFLNQEKAEIYLPKSGIRYSASGHNDSPGLKALLQDGLNLTDAKATELLSRKGELPKAFTNKKKLPAVGKFIDAIHFSVESEDIDLDKMLHLNACMFGTRGEFCSIDDSIEIDKPEFMYHLGNSVYKDYSHDKWSINRLSPELVNVSKSLVSYSINQLEEEDSFGAKELFSFPFNEQIKELVHELGVGLLSKTNKNLYNLVLDYLDVYEKFMASEFATYCLIPGYIDFYLPSNAELIKKSVEKNLRTYQDLVYNPAYYSHERWVLNRYEHLWACSSSNISVKNWSINHKALLILAFFDFSRYEMYALTRAMRIINKEVIYTFFSSENNDGTNYQEHQLSIDELIEVLKEYNFVHGVNESFQLNGVNLLIHRVQKYPDPEEIDNKWIMRNVRNSINSELIRYFHKKILIDLNAKFIE